MEKLRRTSQGMVRFAKTKYIIGLLLLLMVILVIMEKGPFSSEKLKELSGGKGMLDMQFGYSQGQVYSFLGRIGAAGRVIYMKLLCLDIVFSIVFMLLQSLIMTALLKTAAVPGRYRMFNLLPFVRSILDMTENCFLLMVILQYPAKRSVVVAVSSIVTLLKWAFMVMVMVLLLILCVAAVWKSTMNRKRKWGKAI